MELVFLLREQKLPQ